MAENSGFFNANALVDDSTGEITFDRVYLADAFAKYFASFLSNGVFGGLSGELQVLTSTTPSMSVRVRTGQGYINGYWYENTEDLPIQIPIANGTSPRIDTIVLRYGNSERKIWAATVTGIPSNNPQEPTLQRNPDYFELKLCSIRVGAGVTVIRQQDITDTRLDRDVCGLVMGLIQQFDTTAFGVQLQTFINDYMLRMEQDYDGFLINLESYRQLAYQAYLDFVAYLQTLQAQGQLSFNGFMDWLLSTQDMANRSIQDMLDQLQGLLDGEIASQLTQRIHALEVEVPNEQVVDINHNLGYYPCCTLYEFDYGAGVQGAGIGPAGGGPLTSTPTQYTMADVNNIVVFAKSGYGVVEVVSKLTENTYAVAFVGSLTCLLIIMRR